MAQDLKKFEAYKKAQKLMQEIYLCAKRISDGDRDYEIPADLSQTVVRISGAIVRGSAFDEDRFREFLEEARLAVQDLDIQLMVAHDLGVMTRSTCDRLLRMTEELRQLLIRRIEKGRVTKA